MYKPTVSKILKSKDLITEEPKVKTREDRRKEKELEEARKSGTALAAVDETGKNIDPHIPNFIVSAPWYYDVEGPTLRHQRIQKEKIKPKIPIDQYYERGLKGKAAIKFRDGACKNCGSMGHNKKSCLERPRSIGAKYTNSNIAPDELQLPKFDLDFEGKRDRWNGYNPDDYKQVYDKYAKIDEVKKVLKEKKLAEEGSIPIKNDDEDSEDDEKYAEKADMPGTRVDSKQRITVRNLRFRDDPPKYLLNLDLNSAHYDPKSRSMRDDPFANSNKKKENLLYSGDSFVRYSGDSKKQLNTQLFAWQAYSTGVNINLQTEPTQAEILFREFSEKKKNYNISKKNSLLEKYGGEKHLESLPKELIYSQTDNYLEYNHKGEVKEGYKKNPNRSIYDEDVYPYNHTSVWGSYWKDGQWGFKCCHSLIHNSYCTGTVEQNNDSITTTVNNQNDDDKTEAKTLVQIHQELQDNKNRKKKKDKKKNQRKSSSSSSEESDTEEQKSAKLKKALEKEEERLKEGERLAKMCDRKRPYNSMTEDKAPTKEELEAYQMKRMRTEDPIVSEILKNKQIEEPKKKTREEWRKDKELEEARKAGTAPAAVDETGKDINPHIPQYISSAPWYYGSSGPTLKHQRIQPDKLKSKTTLGEYYVRELKGPTATKFRDGACKNCGAMGHEKKFCLERPRKIGAKFTSRNIAPDERQLPKLDMDFDGKRDRWNGYNSADYQEIIDRYSKIEEAKRVLKEQKLALPGTSSSNDNNDDDDDEDEEKYADNADMPGTKVDSKQRITVRNLRIREDVAKYLLNLDINSAYYDPKTRSMRDDPFSESVKKREDLLYGGDSFVRYSGDTKKHVNAQLFAWQAYEKGVDVHLQAEPTKAELLHQEFSTKKEQYKESIKDNVLAKYGGEEHLESLPKELIYSQTENYVEYNRQGEVKGGQEKASIKSKYEEDVYINNHTSVWGSYWKNGQWGYKCCYSFIYNSYCTGAAGQDVESTPPVSIIPIVNEEDEVPEEEPKTLVQIHQELQAKKNNKKKKKIQKKKKSKNSSSSSSSSSEESDTEEQRATKLKKALEKEEENQREGERLAKMCDRKRPYNSMVEVKAPTEEEMEAYRMKRMRADDPMSAFMNNSPVRGHISLKDTLALQLGVLPLQG
ncbi:SLU7, partial [Cordylochernes scorpioides]